MGMRNLHAVIYKDAESDQWVAVCLELDVATQGDNEQHALAMIQEAVELHLEDISQTELDSLFQPIEGEPRLHEFQINAPALLNF